MKPLWKVVQIVRYTWVLVAKNKSNTECHSGEKTGAGKRREPNVSTSVDVAFWLECTMKRVSDGDRSTSLSFLSCGALQSDEIIGILKVLFRYVGIGTQLAMCNVISMEARELSILVPAPGVRGADAFMCLFLCYTPITSPSAADSFYFLKLLGTG